MSNEQLWQAIIGELEISLSKANFTTWFKNTFIVSQENDGIIVGVPNDFTKAWLENKYHEKIVEALKHLTNNELRQVFYQVETSKKPKNIYNLKESIKEINRFDVESQEKTAERDLYGLNPKYTFDRFVVGKNNELAHAAAKAVVKTPGKAYNPLFVYGRAGLGKTHLLQAVGHEILKNNPSSKLIYVTSEKFTNEFISALRSNKIPEFQQKYRSIDVLIIDDIQFMAGKEQTQEQFFHTFNELYQKDKQVILSSDRSPKAINNLEQRLQTRFEWGMIADISEPDYETRVAILEQKLLDRNFPLEKETIEYLAENIQTNIREMEGVINYIYATYQLNNKKPGVEEIKNALQSLNTIIPKSSLSIKSILNTVSEFYDISVSDLIGSCRKKELVFPRQIAMYLIRDEINSSYINIGSEFGGRDHTTVIHACEKIKEELNNNSKTRQDIVLLKQKLYSN
jgi:chromosomal replication initiator protein